MINKDTTQKIPSAEIIKGLNDGINNADSRRVDGLTQLHGIRIAKENQYEREYKRLSEKLGNNHPRVLVLNEKRVLNTDFADTLEKHAARASIEVPDSDDRSWILHGRVMDKQEKGLPGLIISLVDARKNPLENIDSVTTDREGHFKISVVTDKTAASNETGYATNIRQGLFISVSDKRQTLIHVDDQSLVPAPGNVDYREIIIEEELSVCMPDKGAEPKEKNQPGIKGDEKNSNAERKPGMQISSEPSSGGTKPGSMITKPK